MSAEARLGALSLAVVMQLTANPACSHAGMVPQFWPHVIRAESGLHPYALHDDTTDRSYYPETKEAALSKALELLNSNHSVGIGLSQLTARSQSEFQRKFRITVADALDACKNLATGAWHFVRGALSVYNSGSTTRSLAYADRILARVDGAAPSGQHVPARAPPPVRIEKRVVTMVIATGPADAGDSEIVFQERSNVRR